MKILVTKNYEDMSQKAASILISSLRQYILKKEKVIFLPSAGKTPTLIYKNLKNFKKEIDWQKIIVVQMDDYIQNNDDKCSFREYLTENLIEPLGIKNFLSLPKLSSVEIAKKYIAHHSFIIKELGGIDLALHGVGTNGHIGFNEPGSTKEQGSDVFELAKPTLEANQVTFKDLKTPSLGMSLGLKTLYEAKENIIVASGKTKQNAIQKLLNMNSFCPSLPVSLLIDRNTTLISDLVC